MLNWITHFFAGVGGAVSSAITSLIQTATAAIAGVMDTVFGHVLSGWKDLARDLDSVWHLAGKFETSVFGHLRQIITHDIPLYAWRSWWLLTHPAALAEWLGWHLVRWLEDNAWALAGHLGAFVISLLLRNATRVAQTAEDIIDAII